jgi:EmrB/QacA subfamily drug resistance transporter
MEDDIKNQQVIGMRSLPKRQVNITLGGVLLALFLGSLDQTIVSTAMPRIVGDLGGFAHYTWLTTAYLVTSTVMLPIIGKLTDMYGRKHFYTAGIIIFVIGSLLSGLSQTMLQIIIFRGFQGIGGGIMMVNAFAVIGDLFPPAQRGKYQGLLSAVFGVSAIIGPVLGGLITDLFSWHWIFFINVPLGLLIITLFVIYFPSFRPNNVKHKIDYLGIVCIIFAVIPLLIALSFGGTEYPWVSPPIMILFGLSLISMVMLPWVEARSEEPIIPLEIFRNSIVVVSVPIIFLTGVVMFGGIIFVPLYFQGVMGLSASASGSFIIPMTLAQVAGSFVSGQLLSRTGGHYRIQGMFGLGIMAMGVFLLSRLTPEVSYLFAIIGTILTGFGLGMTFPLYTIAVQNAVPYNILGVATSMVPFFRFMGGAAGLAVFGSVVANRFSAEFISNLPEAVLKSITPETISSMTHNLQSLMTTGAQSQFAAIFGQFGEQGASLYTQTITVLQQALSSSLTQIFFIGFIVIVVAFIFNLFLKEVPLRKQHVLSEPSNDQ